MFQQVFQQLDSALSRDPGCISEVDRVEQISWMLLLKYLSYLREKREKSSLSLEVSKVLEERYHWSSWATIKSEMSLDLTEKKLQTFIEKKLFPYLRGLKSSKVEPSSLAYKIGEIFSHIENKVQHSHTLKEAIDGIDSLCFDTFEQKKEISQFYESRIRKIAEQAGRYSIPQVLVEAMVEVVAPKGGETIYDGAIQQPNLLCEAFEYLKKNEPLQAQKRAVFLGRVEQVQYYVFSLISMVLRDMLTSQITHTSVLATRPSRESEYVDVILSEPSFGGLVCEQIQENFPIKIAEPASLFLQHYMKVLKKDGRAGLVLKSSVLQNGDSASISLRRELITSCCVHTILVLPKGVFFHSELKAVVLFFEKGLPTQKIWYYQLDPERFLDESHPIHPADLKDFLTLQKSQDMTVRSWTVPIQNIDRVTCDLSPRNPCRSQRSSLRYPQEIMSHMAVLDRDEQKLFQSLKEVLWSRER